LGAGALIVASWVVRLGQVGCATCRRATHYRKNAGPENEQSCINRRCDSNYVQGCTAQRRSEVGGCNGDAEGRLHARAAIRLVVCIDRRQWPARAPSNHVPKSWKSRITQHVTFTSAASQPKLKIRRAITFCDRDFLHQRRDQSPQQHRASHRPSLLPTRHPPLLPNDLTQSATVREQDRDARSFRILIPHGAQQLFAAAILRLAFPVSSSADATANS
jgi:hypothetical protein